MKTKSMMLLAVAVACGLVAMLGVRQALQKDGELEKVKVLIATADILPGLPLDENNTEFKEVTIDSAPEGVVTRLEEINKRALSVRAVPGEFIMLAKLGPEGSISPSSEIPHGMRVVTVAVDLTKSNSGLVRPKDRVDLLVSFKKLDETNRSTAVTKTFLEFIEVFSVDSTRKGNGKDDVGEGAKNFSLLVTPEQAAIIKLAESEGKITFVMRGPEDDMPTKVADVTADLFNDSGTKAGVREEEVTETDNSNVQNFLLNEEENNKDVSTTVEEEPVVEVEPEVETPMWTMTIGTGTQVEQVEVVDEEQLLQLQQERDARIEKRLEEAAKTKEVTNKKKDSFLLRSAKALFSQAISAEQKN